MGVKDIIRAVPLTSLSSADITTSYQPINGPDGLPNSCFLLKINNFSNETITISYDGSVDHDQVYLETSAEIYGGIASSQPENENCLWAKGQIVYVKGTAGTGSVSLAGYYQPLGE